MSPRLLASVRFAVSTAELLNTSCCVYVLPASSVKRMIGTVNLRNIPINLHGRSCLKLRTVRQTYRDGTVIRVDILFHVVVLLTSGTFISKRPVQLICYALVPFDNRSSMRVIVSRSIAAFSNSMFSAASSISIFVCSIS